MYIYLFVNMLVVNYSSFFNMLGLCKLMLFAR